MILWTGWGRLRRNLAAHGLVFDIKRPRVIAPEGVWAFMGVAGARRGGAACCAMILSTMLAGCAVGPDFATPPAPVADTWLEWRNRSLKTGPEEYRVQSQIFTVAEKGLGR